MTWRWRPHLADVLVLHAARYDETERRHVLLAVDAIAIHFDGTGAAKRRRVTAPCPELQDEDDDDGKDDRAADDHLTGATPAKQAQHGGRAIPRSLLPGPRSRAQRSGRVASAARGFGHGNSGFHQADQIVVGDGAGKDDLVPGVQDPLAIPRVQDRMSGRRRLFEAEIRGWCNRTAGSSPQFLLPIPLENPLLGARNTTLTRNASDATSTRTPLSMMRLSRTRSAKTT